MCQVLLPIVFSSLLLGVLANGFTPYATHHCFNGKCSVVGVDCGDPGTPKDGTKLGETYTYMFSVHFECNPGFVMNGSHFRTCLKSGELS